jgi:hypothetical protein
MAAQQSKTHPAFVKVALVNCISLTFAIPMATNYARFIACRLPELLRVKTRKDRSSWGGPVRTFGGSGRRSKVTSWAAQDMRKA